MAHPLKAYWKLYGGAVEFLRSPYLFVAVVITVVCYPFWVRGKVELWPDISISILPGLMGFSIAAMAILLAFSDQKSIKAITQRGKEDSYFVKTAANLFHFLIVQVVALVLAILGKAFPDLPVPMPAYALSFFGLWALIYAIFVSVAAAGQLLNTARIVNKAVWVSDSNDKHGQGET